MNSKVEQFWIKFILRFAFGFLFVVAALNIFDYGGPNDFGPDAFATSLSKPFMNTWLGGVLGWLASGLNAPFFNDVPYYFLFGMPYVFAVLSVPILLGIMLRPALRLSALFLVILGIGKYVSTPQDLSTTAQDFLLAAVICAGLFFLGQEKQETEEDPYPSAP